MPCLSGIFDPIQGIFINIAVAKPGEITSATKNLKIPNFVALVDTGASKTCISKQAAQTAGLIAIGKSPMVSATHTVDMDNYLADIFLPFGAAPLGGTTGLVINSISILEFNCETNCSFQILLGRDVLTKGIFTISFDGHFSFAI
jgi:hypothetical protein